MATTLQNLSDFNAGSISAAEMTFGIVVSEWNTEVTEALYNGCVETLRKYGATDSNISRVNVPGSYELTTGALFFAEYSMVDAIICLGCVIQGETRHFDFICSAVAHGLTNVSIKFNKPVIFGVLTPDTMQQAIDRSGGKHGNKGDEAAITAIKMVQVKRGFQQS